MADASEVAKASIAVQMETSNLESRIVAGEAVDFNDLDHLVIEFKLLAESDSPEPEPDPST